MINDNSLLLFLGGAVLMFQVSFLRGHSEIRDRIRTLEKEIHDLDREEIRDKIRTLETEMHDLDSLTREENKSINTEIQEIKTSLSKTSNQVNSMDIMKYDYPTPKLQKNYNTYMAQSSLVMSSLDNNVIQPVLDNPKPKQTNQGTRSQPSLDIRSLDTKCNDSV
jgi:septal ring factor EnvC (AmiA/AmiB activator)